MTFMHVRSDDDFFVDGAKLRQHMKFIGTTFGHQEPYVLIDEPFEGPFVFIDGKADSQAILILEKLFKRRELTRVECLRRKVRFLPLQVMRPIFAANDVL